jgi:hypothetical protein
MWRKALALLGLLIFVGGVVLLTAEIVQQQAQIEEPAVTQIIGLMEFRTAIVAGAGIFLGPLLAVPWWLERLRREEKWFEKRDEPLDGPPRVPN